MITRSRLLSCLLLTALTGLMYGCGSGGGTSAATPVVQSGKLAQGPVAGATVFADRIGGGTRFVLDADEVRATTDSNGNYVLPSVPNYTYVLVSKGGVDTLSGQPALQLLAQAGSANITPLTTLITLDSTKTLYTKLQALQPVTAPIDFDVSTASTPAMLLLVKSVEIAVQSITAAVNAKAAASGFVITEQQNADIQFQAFQQIALGFAGTLQKLETPAGLKLALEAGLAQAVTEINKAANINLDATAAAAIANNAVTSASSLNPALLSAAILSVSAIQVEKGLASAATFAATIAFANAPANPAFAAISNATTTSASTPSPYGPASIFILFVNTLPGVITGSTGTGGTGGSGTGGGFKPVL